MIHMFRLTKKSAENTKESKEKNKNHTEIGLEVIPYESWKMPAPIVDLVVGYAIDTPWIINKSIFFSGVDCTLHQILFLAEHADSIDKFKFFVGKLIEKEKLAYEAKKIDNQNEIETYSLIDRIFTLGTRQGTLVQCLVSGLDTKFRKNEGMADCFINQIKQLLPHKLPIVLEQAQQAAKISPNKYLAVLKEVVLDQQEQQPPPSEEFEEEDKQTDSEKTKSIAHKYFNAFIQDDEEIIHQTQIKFKESVKRIQSRHINNLYFYYENLIYLIGIIDEITQLAKKDDTTLSEEQQRKIERLCFDLMNVLRESINLGAIKLLFDAFKSRNEYIIDASIERFKKFVELTKRYSTNETGYFINNQFYINLIHLIYGAFDELVRRGRELPDLGEGEYGNKYCIKVIGAILQANLPPFLRQRLRWEVTGLNGLLNNYEAPREIDPTGKLFFCDSYDKSDNNTNVLGINFYFDMYGPAKHAIRASNSENTLLAFKAFYEELNQCPDFMLQLQTQQRRCSLM